MVTRWSGAAMALTLGLAIATGSATAVAGEDAAEKFEEGVSFFKARKFKKAAAAFEQAYKLKPTYKLQFNIGQAHAAARNYGLAVKAFERYLVDGGDNLTNERREEVVGELARLRPLVGFLKVRGGEEGLQIKIDGRVRGTTPFKGKIGLTVGRFHIVELVRGDEVVFVEEVEVDSGAFETIEVPGGDATSTAAPPPDAEEQEEEPEEEPAKIDKDKLNLAGWITLGTGGAALIAGGVVGILALTQSGTLDDNCPDGGCSPARDGEIDALGKMALTTDILLGVGAAAAVTGAVLLIIANTGGDDEAGSEDAGAGEPEVSLLPSPAGLALDVRF